MKKSLFALFIFLFSVNVMVLSSCNGDDDDDDDDVLRSAELQVNISGDYSQSVNQTIAPGSQTHSAAGAFNSLVGTLGIQFSEGATWFINLTSFNATEIATGTYDLADPAGSSVYYHTATGAPSGFYSVSGSMTITESESTTPLGKPTDRYVTGSFSGVFTTDEDPPRTVNVSGSFKDVYVLYN